MEKQCAVILFAISINTVVVLLLLIYCSILLQPVYLRTLWLNQLIINSNNNKKEARVTTLKDELDNLSYTIITEILMDHSYTQ